MLAEMTDTRVKSMKSSKSDCMVVSLASPRDYAESFERAMLSYFFYTGVSCLAVICHTQEEVQSQPLPPEVLSPLWSRPDFLQIIVKLQQTLDLQFLVRTLALRLIKNAVETEDDSMLTTLLGSEVELASTIRAAMTSELFTCFKKYVCGL